MSEGGILPPELRGMFSEYGYAVDAVKNYAAQIEAGKRTLSPSFMKEFLDAKSKAG